MSSKLEKKSFLDRVLSRRESPRGERSKTNKRHRYKGKASSNPSSSLEEIPTYDDVSDLTSNQESLADREELPEYNCPPPPRPIYEVKSSAGSSNQIQEFYDDVSAYQGRRNKNRHHQVKEVSQDLFLLLLT